MRRTCYVTEFASRKDRQKDLKDIATVDRRSVLVKDLAKVSDTRELMPPIWRVSGMFASCG